MILIIDKKSFENTLTCNISYKTMIGANPVRIRFDKVDEFIRAYDGTRYLVSFASEKYDAIYNRIMIRYLIRCCFSKLCKNRNWFIWFFDSGKKFDLHNVIRLIKSVLFNQSHYYYNISFEKCSYQLAEK